MACLSDFSMMLDNVLLLYKDDRLLDCLSLIRDVEQQLESFPAPTTPTDSAAAMDITRRLESDEIKRIKREAERAERLYTTLTTDGADKGSGSNADKEDNWTLSYDGADTKVWYKRNDDGILSLRMQGSIKAPLLHVAALLYESDLYSSLFWYVSASHVLPLVQDDGEHEINEQTNSLKRAVHITTFAPWPMYRRDVTLYAYAVDALQSHNCVIVLSSSISSSSSSKVVSYIPDTQRRVVRAVIHESGFIMTPVSPNLTKASFTYHIDPKLDFIPATVVNWAARTMCRWSVRVLEARARDLDAISPLYNQRMQERPVYQRIRGRLEQYWEERKADPQSSEPHSEHLSERKESHVTFDPNEKPAVPSSFFQFLRQK